MADKDKSGIEMLRKLAVDANEYANLWVVLKIDRANEWGAAVRGSKLSDILEFIADRIERERAEELAAARRGLTDEARDVAERLRAIDDGECTGADRCWEILIEALGADSIRYGAAASWQNDMILTRDRLIELIEHGSDSDPEELGADGLPIKEGETVYLANPSLLGKKYPGWGPKYGDALTVDRITHIGVVCGNDTFTIPSELTHTPPDTQERIDEDADKDCCEYFGGERKSCVECPSPGNISDSGRCDTAMITDLLRRQRELDAKTTG